MCITRQLVYEHSFKGLNGALKHSSAYIIFSRIQSICIYSLVWRQADEIFNTVNKVARINIAGPGGFQNSHSIANTILTIRHKTNYCKITFLCINIAC